MKRQIVLIAGLQLAMACGLAGGVSAQQQPEASNMRLVGMNDLQARSAYQPTIHHQGERWIAYIGHHGGTDEIPDPVNPMTGKAEPNGTSIVDVTNPAQPKYLRHIPGQEGKYEGGGAQMVRVCDGKSLPKGDPAAVYMLRTFGSEAHEIWNVADPANPVLVTRLGGLKDTHKSWWECDTGIAFLVSGAPGWRTRRMTQVYDLGDPAHPVKIRDFGLPGQEPGATGAVPTDLHGPISTGVKGNRVYFGYGANKGGILQIVDREKRGAGIEVYVRPKIGFCNSATGVADDDEVDRVSDVDLISERFAPVQPGSPIRIAGLAGRARRYRLTMPDGSARAVEGIAVSQNADLVVALVSGDVAAEPAQRAAHAFLASDAVMAWVHDALDGR